MANEFIHKVMNDNFEMVKKAKNCKIWNAKLKFKNLLITVGVMFGFIVTELSEALQKKAISLLTGGAVDLLQTGNGWLRGNLFTWLQNNRRHAQ